MNRSDYDKLKTEIIQKHGEPTFDLGTPTNESARRITELRTQYRVACLKASRDVAKETKLKQAADFAKDLQDTKSKYVQLPEIQLSDAELAPFNETEINILISHFENLNLTPKQLAHKHHMSYQKVVALFNSAAYKLLYAKVFDRILPIESLIAIRQAMRNGDSKVSLTVARHYKLIKDETLDINNTIKPIEDNEALKKLKEMGDNLV